MMSSVLLALFVGRGQSGSGIVSKIGLPIGVDAGVWILGASRSDLWVLGKFTVFVGDCGMGDCAVVRSLFQ